MKLRRLGSRGLAAAGLVALLQSGCCTGINLWMGAETDEPSAFGHKWDTRVYGGVQNALQGIGNVFEGEPGAGPLWHVAMFLGLLIDTPLSLVADTLTLPYTIPYVLTRPDPNE